MVLIGARVSLPRANRAQGVSTVPSVPDQNQARPSQSAHTTLLQVVAVFALALILREIWCLALPLDAGNDEIVHLYTARLYASLGRLAIVGRDPGTTAFFHPVHGFNSLPYFFDPPGAHAVGAALLTLLGDKPSAYLWLRQLGVVAGSFTVVLAYLTLQILWPTPSRVPYAVSILMALVPEVVFVGSYFSDEWFALLASALVYFAMARVLRDGLSPRTLLLSGFSLAVLSLARLTYWPAAAALILAIGLRCKSASWRIRAGLLLALALPVLTAGDWIGRNQRLYADWRGGVAGGVAQASPAGSLPGFSFEPTGIVVQARHPYLYRYGSGYLALSTFMSFWGVYGYMGLLMPAPYYALWCLVWVVAASGWVLAYRRVGFGVVQDSERVLGVGLFVVPLLVVLLAHFYFNIAHPTAAYQPQGRYLFCGILPVLTLFVLGWREILRKLCKETTLVPLCAAIGAVTNIWSLAVVLSAPWPRVLWIPGA